MRHRELQAGRAGLVPTVAVLSLVGLCLVGFYFSEDIRWRLAVRSESAGAYKDFLDRYPDGKHARAARENLERLSWIEAQRSGKAAAMEQFIKNFPKSAHIEEARSKLDDLVWAAATDEQTLKQYAAAFPKGKHIAECRAALLEKSLSALPQAKGPIVVQTTEGKYWVFDPSAIAKVEGKSLSLKGGGYRVVVGSGKGPAQDIAQLLIEALENNEGPYFMKGGGDATVGGQFGVTKPSGASLSMAAIVVPKA